MIDYLYQYQKKVAALSLELHNANAAQSVVLNKTTSNLFRNRTAASHKINVHHLNQVLKINTDECTAEVEGMTTYEALVQKTLAENLMPCVVPQLKTITVGGALSGVAIESSSFRYGLVHETFLEFDVCLANGDVITCTPTNEHSELFFSFPNSYGTLGYATRVKLRCVPVKKYVKLTHTFFQDPKAFYAAIDHACQPNSPYDFVDGVCFDQNKLYLTTGTMVDEAPYHSDYTFLNIYYRSLLTKKEDYLTIHDYIWRWDTDWFWCSKNFGMQNILMRLLFGSFMLRSNSYWKVMHFSRNNAIAKKICDWLFARSESVIQDVEIPLEHCQAFHDFYYQNINIKPMWVCPVRCYQSDHTFPFYALKPNSLFINFGFWEAIPSNFAPGHFNRLLEETVAKLQGHKSLYSAVYYTEQQFWDIFDRDLYQRLKKRYDPQAKLKDLYHKVTEK